MARHKAVFGGEHSAHYYFRDFWYADTGMLAAMHVLAALGEQDGTAVRPGRGAQPLRRLRRDQLHGRGRRLRPPPRVRQWASSQDVEFDELDGLTVTHRGEPMWWFNLRAATPSRCCGSTSRRPTSRRWRGCATTCSPSSEESTDDRAHLRRPDRRAARTADRAVAARDPALPRCHGELVDGTGPDRARAAVHQPGVRARLPDRRRHPRPPGRRGPFPHRADAGATRHGAVPRRDRSSTTRRASPPSTPARRCGPWPRRARRCARRSPSPPMRGSTGWPAVNGPGRCSSPRSAARAARGRRPRAAGRARLAGAGQRPAQPAAARLGRAARPGRRGLAVRPRRGAGGRWPPRRPAAARRC